MMVSVVKAALVQIVGACGRRVLSRTLTIHLLSVVASQSTVDRLVHLRVYTRWIDNHRSHPLSPWLRPPCSTERARLRLVSLFFFSLTFDIVQDLLATNKANPPSFTIHFHPDYWALNNGPKFLYQNQIAVRLPHFASAPRLILC